MNRTYNLARSSLIEIHLQVIVDNRPPENSPVPADYYKLCPVLMKQLACEVKLSVVVVSVFLENVKIILKNTNFIEVDLSNDGD